MRFRVLVYSGLLLLCGTVAAAESFPKAAEKSFYGSGKLVHGYAFLPAPDRSRELIDIQVTTGAVPFSDLLTEHNISFNKKNHEFSIKYTGVYEIQFFFQAVGFCLEPQQEFSNWVARTVDVAIQVNKKLVGYTKILPFMNGPFAVFIGQGTLALHLRKKDKVKLIVDDLPRGAVPVAVTPFSSSIAVHTDVLRAKNGEEDSVIVYSNLGHPSRQKDTCAYLYISKKE